MEQEENDLPYSTKAPRALTTKAKIIKNRSEGIKPVVQYNDMGVMVGEVKTDLVSIIGILARTTIPITYDDWRCVPRHIKDKLWEYVKKTRKEQQKKRKKNKYDHRLSRKGYVGLIEELKKNPKYKGKSLDRSLLWRLARQDKNEKFDSDTQSVVDKIDQLMQQYDEGSLQVVDSQDVLTMALGTPEHSGRVRAELEAEIQSLKQQNSTPKHSKVSSSNMPNKVCMDDQEMCILPGLETNVEGGACKLAIDCKENIVATGTIIEYKSSNCLVSIKVVFDRDADFLIADDDESLVKVNDVVGHHVFWPKNLVIHTPKIVKIPPSLKAFATLVDRCVTPSTDIVIKNDCDMFGYKCSTHISLDDCRHILSMVEIGVACLNVYIRLLYDELKENEMAGQFGFINPASVSLSGGLANSKRSIEKSRMVAKGLENASQSRYVFIPYNPG
ncbi:hypothetical protein Q3G72_025108 [Acer saccharum]|nr:hypothetical protein Q3G72_025108 [Acer saccharum]